MSSIIKVGKVQSSTGNDAVTIANDGTITANGAIDSLKTDTISEKTSANGVSIDGLKVKDYSLMYGSNIGLTIDSSGYALTPKTVWFHAYNGAAQNPDNTTIEVVEFSTANQDSSNSYNASTDSNTFTAPVGGTYYFSYMFMNNSSEHCRHSFYINNSAVNTKFSKNEVYNLSTNFWVGTLANGDSVNARINTAANNEGNIHNDYRVFTGFLIG